MLRSLEQDRAKYAWKCIKYVKEVEDQPEELQKSYKSYVKKTPALILSSGFGNALAFFQSKYKTVPENQLKPEKKAYKILYEHIDGWFRREANKDILDWVVNDATSIEVFRKTEEAIALLNWMKRFADAELKGEESE